MYVVCASFPFSNIKKAVTLGQVRQQKKIVSYWENSFRFLKSVFFIKSPELSRCQKRKYKTIKINRGICFESKSRGEGLDTHVPDEPSQGGHKNVTVTEDTPTCTQERSGLDQLSVFFSRDPRRIYNIHVSITVCSECYRL